MINETQSQIQEKIIGQTLEFYKKNSKGHLLLAQRFGKCKSTIEFLKRKFDFMPTVLISYPDNKLLQTWDNEIKLWQYHNWNITFVNFSSLWKYQTKIFDVFIIDEWHSLSSKELEIAKEISNNDEISITLGLSGTVGKETQNNWKELKEIAKYTTNQGIDDGILSNYAITVHLVDLDNKIKYLPSKKGLITEKKKYDGYSYVMKTMDYKSKTFFHLALARNRLSLSSIGKTEYTRKLLSKQKEKRTLVYCGLDNVAKSLKIPYFNSKSAEDSIFMNFLEERINHLALSNMGKVGVTFPNLDSVILLNFSYNSADSSQILQRAAKLDYNNKVADLHVICLNELPEIKKVKESLSMLDQSKIKYV